MPDPDRKLRLEGDALYHWAQMIAELDFARKSLTAYGAAQIDKMGLDPDNYVIDNEGFIHPQDPRPDLGQVRNERAPIHQTPDSGS